MTALYHFHQGRYTSCASKVRRVNVDVVRWTSPYCDTNILKHYPLLIAVDITNEDLDEGWDKWNRDIDEGRGACQGSYCHPSHTSVPRGETACFEQTPRFAYSFLAAVGRRYLITWVVRCLAFARIQVVRERLQLTYYFALRPIVALGL